MHAIVTFMVREDTVRAMVFESMVEIELGIAPTSGARARSSWLRHRRHRHDVPEAELPIRRSAEPPPLARDSRHHAHHQLTDMSPEDLAMLEDCERTTTTCA